MPFVNRPDRQQIERITQVLRNQGHHRICAIVRLARETGMRLVQLTSNAVRTDAHRFYERLGFSPSHIGFKMKLKREP